MATLKTLVSFSYTSGEDYPGISLIDAAGDLFGTTYLGGANSAGSVFEIANTGGGYANTLTTLVSFNFDGTNGAALDTSLSADAAGDLFATTFEGGANEGGTVFEIIKTSGTYATTPTTLVSFNGTDGNSPEAGLITDAAGNLFGTTVGGGANTDGTVFEINNTDGTYASTPTTLVSFNGTDGETPDSPLTADAAGDLFSTTFQGGANGDGTVFEIAKTSGGYAKTPITLFNFNASFTYTDPTYAPNQDTGDLIADPAGDLFGTTISNGANGDGSVFEIANTSTGYASTPTTLVSFNGADGAEPNYLLTIDAAGDLFGTTPSGGANGDGTVFEIIKTSGTYATSPTTLLNFNGTDGGGSGLIPDAAGDLFGETTQVGETGAGPFVGTVFELTNTGFVICFLAGTRIATPGGEVSVEQLAVDGKVVTQRGEARRIVWIGAGRVLATRGRRNAATPVIVRKGALADNVPHHDLRVTKAHSLYIDGVLIPVEFLVNHRSILWDDHAQEVRLYHIELETHDVLLANGAPAESYRDDGNRWLFQNANSGWSLPPQEPCAPVLTGGPLVDAVWRRLLERAGPRKNLPLTDDADLHVLADGQRLDAADRVGEVHMFRLPAIPSALHIVSRAAAPAELGLARDPRMLGVALRRFAVRKGTRFRVTEAKDGRLTEGFHAFEADNGIRWTDGHASSPPELYDGFTAPLELVLHIAATARYLADSSVQCVA